ncbi:hypothetical protein RND81_05G025000 [Saponaria officinalis]|uniref:Late embryogenesis abundant protein LEA-2 subgroup domain-containing protein n=1 Tax=Saponaria officinalis TaxID=3572 RepID=A0AAW1KSM9_SAPOF
MTTNLKKTATTMTTDDGGDEKRQKQRRRFLTIISVVILTVLLLSILGATVFRAKNPITTVNSIVLRNFDVSFDALNLNVFINVSIDADISVKNPNKVGLKYTDSSAYLDYRGQVVGQAPIPAGQISAGQTKAVELTLTVMADRLLSNSRAVIADVVSGTLPLTTRTKISGKVSLLFIKIRVVSYSVCNMNISISSKSVLSNECKYDTRLS